MNDKQKKFSFGALLMTVPSLESAKRILQLDETTNFILYVQQDTDDQNTITIFFFYFLSFLNYCKFQEDFYL